MVGKLCTFDYAMLALLIIVTLLETCSWTEFKLNSTTSTTIRIPVHLTNLNPDMATVELHLDGKQFGI